MLVSFKRILHLTGFLRQFTLFFKEYYVSKVAIIIGAGPAGLTAAYDLLRKTDIKPIIFEQSQYIGGISKTVNYKGNRIDIGGHRFFSKSARVMDWWQNIFPLQGAPSKDDIILERKIPLSNTPNSPDPEKEDKVMLIRSRLSRIFFLRHFFDYPISIKWKTFKNLGIIRVIKIISSYLYIICFPVKEEKSLEDFFVNRFGWELYRTFFEDYTKKVWGVPCNKIKPEWGAQRVKGLSISKTLIHAIRTLLKKEKSIEQKTIETSLIEQFLYPKYGPGQLWEEVASQVKARKGEIYLNSKVIGLIRDKLKITYVLVKDCETQEVRKIRSDFVFSTMPVKELILSMQPSVTNEIKEVAEGLMYRDFITVGILLKELKIKNETKIKTVNNIIPDNWIYIQERDVKLGRIQIFNNWSPYLVKDERNIWLGLEYFANEGDELWNKTDKELSQFATSELEQIGFIEQKDDVLDSVVIRTPKAYPAYFGSYDKFDIIKQFADQIENLFLIGRNGMHKYNNQDHSMLTAMEAVNNVINNKKTKENIWLVNAEQEYHETN